MIVANLLSKNVQVKRRPLLDRVDSKDLNLDWFVSDSSQKRGRLSVKNEQRGTKNTSGIASPVDPEALPGRLVKTLPIFSS
jgi:hypothetical protein